MIGRSTLVAAALVAIAAPAAADCRLTWDYEDGLSAWIEGFRVYQNGQRVADGVRPDVREADCAVLGLTPGPGPITMTAFRGSDESAPSDPAVFTLSAPGLRMELGF